MRTLSRRTAMLGILASGFLVCALVLLYIDTKPCREYEKKAAHGVYESTFNPCDADVSRPSIFADGAGSGLAIFLPLFAVSLGADLWAGWRHRRKAMLTGTGV